MSRGLTVGCVAYVAAWLWAAALLPDPVPMHFGPGGTPDRWAGRTEALVTLAVIGAGTAALLWACERYARRGSLAGVNAPHKRWWLASPDRAERFRAMVGQDLAVVGAATMVLLAGVVAAVTVAAQQPDPALPWWFWALLAGYLAGVLALAVWAYVARYRPDGGGPR